MTITASKTLRADGNWFRVFSLGYFKFNFKFYFTVQFDGKNREKLYSSVIVFSYKLLKYCILLIFSGTKHFQDNGSAISAETIDFKMKISTKLHANLFDSLVITTNK